MGFQLQNNNTLIISARIYAEIHAKTWIWKGIDFGYLGCLKTTACNGDIVTYSAEMDLELELQITIIGGQISILIRPVYFKLHDTNVSVSFYSGAKSKLIF